MRMTDEPGYAMPGRTYACAVIWPMVYFSVGVVLFALVPGVRWLAVPFCLSIVPLCAVMLAGACLWARTGATSVSWPVVLLGWFVIVTGSAADIFATVYHSPTLDREANPTLRAFLDRGYGLEFAYAFGAAVQFLWIGTALALWYGLARHRNEIVATMPPTGSLLAYLKAGTGAREKTYRQWLFPSTWAELPWAYHYSTYTAAFFVAVAAYRYYVAAEWFGLVPLDPLWVRLIAPSVCFVILCVVYAGWLKQARREMVILNELPVPLTEEARDA